MVEIADQVGGLGRRFKRLTPAGPDHGLLVGGEIGEGVRQKPGIMMLPGTGRKLRLVTH